jgi:magnesium transporter
MRHNSHNENAGEKIITHVPICNEDTLVSEVIGKIKEERYQFLDYVYVIDKEKRIKGVFSVRDLFLKEGNTRVGDFMEKNVICVKEFTDQEKVAILALKKKLKAVPVLDDNGYFLGTVPFSAILCIQHHEHREDILRSVGIVEENKHFQEASSLVVLRLPWLIIGLIGGIFAAQIVSLFEESLKEYFLIAAFVPLILYMANAVGAQTQTLYIRSLVFADFETKKYFSREVRVSVVLALFLSIILSLLSFLLFREAAVSLVLGVSLSLTIIAAVFLSIIIPFTFQRMKIDPALGSGPFATIFADITSLVIYFFVSLWLLGIFS